MQTIYLIRHGGYDNPRSILAGRLPVELSSKGCEQIEKLKEYFCDKNVNKIYSSEVFRCKQTSEIISDNKIPIVYDARLLEGLSAYQGYWTTDWKNFYSHVHVLGGESHQDIHNRMVKFFEEVAAKEKNDFIIVSHGDPIFILMHYLSGKPLPPEGQQESSYPDYPQVGSVVQITQADGIFQVEFLNI